MSIYNNNLTAHRMLAHILLLYKVKPNMQTMEVNMSIFSRFKDIVSSNINVMLDKAEDPEKMIRLMIQEMEETLVELKSSCAGIMADKKMTQREQELLIQQVQKWQMRAELAISKERDDLATEALVEKNNYHQKYENLNEDLNRYNVMIKQAQEDINQIEGKIDVAREKQHLLVKRHIRAGQKLRTQKEIRRVGSAQVFHRFEEFEMKIDRLEAEAGLINSKNSTAPRNLDDEFDRLENEDIINEELKMLKKKSENKNNTEVSDKNIN